MLTNLEYDSSLIEQELFTSAVYKASMFKIHTQFKVPMIFVRRCNFHGSMFRLLLRHEKLSPFFHLGLFFEFELISGQINGDAFDRVQLSIQK